MSDAEPNVVAPRTKADAERYSSDVVSPMLAMALKVDASAAEAALAQLGSLAKSFPDSVERFLNSSLDLSQIICINSGDGAASRAGEFRISLEPSDGLREFLAAFPAGNVE